MREQVFFTEKRKTIVQAKDRRKAQAFYFDSCLAEYTANF